MIIKELSKQSNDGVYEKYKIYRLVFEILNVTQDNYARQYLTEALSNFLIFSDYI